MVLNIYYVYYIPKTLLSILYILVAEINEDHPKEKKQFIQNLVWQGNESPSRHLTETQMKAEEWESFIEKNEDTSGMPWVEVVGIGKLEVG